MTKQWQHLADTLVTLKIGRTSVRLVGRNHMVLEEFGCLRFTTKIANPDEPNRKELCIGRPTFCFCHSFAFRKALGLGAVLAQKLQSQQKSGGAPRMHKAEDSKPFAWSKQQEGCYQQIGWPKLLQRKRLLRYD